jgi:hypothetical protein
MYIAAFHRKFGIINMGFIFSEVTKLLRLLYYTQMPDKLNSFFLARKPIAGVLWMHIYQGCVFFVVANL